MPMFLVYGYLAPTVGVMGKQILTSPGKYLLVILTISSFRSFRWLRWFRWFRWRSDEVQLPPNALVFWQVMVHGGIEVTS